MNAKKIDLGAITPGTLNRGAKERGWIFNLEFFKNIKKQDLTPELMTPELSGWAVENENV